ncbi:FAD binding domain-containing protein [Boletus edulis BED1]|uniref:FAD binding domain-containing protein n=1 Tax=Boletus edulis BED1 TaxID=1328754 RepID=A0AAD4BN86_BOLED|nr:FAD binding domain-containing protein [Boletus edulis BED1]
MPPKNRVDVLIVGAGPAGVMCANALAMAGVDVRIIDKRPVKVSTGHADGIQPRMTEVFQSYGLAERLIREGFQLHMSALYHPRPDGGIERTRRVPCVALPTSARYPFVVTLHQGAIEDIFLDSMKEHRVEVERPKQPVNIEISDDVDELCSPSSYPVEVTVESLDTVEENKTEVIHAKFVIGADGAHSWVRNALGIKMEGEQTDYVWGVVDMVPETDFPDIHMHTDIRSSSGFCKIIARERELVRLYIQLLDTDVVDPLTGRVDKNKITPQELLSVAKKIFYPFKLADPKEIDWWTVYISIGQHVASSYSVKDRVFIAGDACHTHSPKAGQGMNASMNDTHNLAWKLVQVLRGWSSPSILKTYEQERRKYAQDLISFDKELATLLSEKPRRTENGDVASDARVFQKFSDFMTGIRVHYFPSAIVDPKHQKCAQNLIIGQRMLPQTFVRAADIRPVEIQDLLPSDVRFKVLVFVGYLTGARVSELKLFAEELNKSSSFLRKYSPDGNISVVFDITTITAGKKEDIDYLLVPAFFRPHWTKVLLDDTDAIGSKGGHGYERFGMDPNQIVLVVVRPDGYVGTIAPSSAVADLDNYFGSFMLPRRLES